MELNALTISLILILGITLVLYIISAQKYEAASVQEVLDGDSILVTNQKYKEGIKVRLLGVDAPEKASHIFQNNEKYAHQATRYVEKKLKPKTKIYLEYDRQKWDEFGRLLAYIYITKNGKSLNAELLKNGYAKVKPHRRNKKYEKQFLKLEQQARQYRLGLWKYRKT